MLFEREPLTPAGRKEVLMRLFGAAARRGDEWSAVNHVPVEVLAAHGDFAAHVRYILDSARNNRALSREHQRLLHKAERLLDSLPECIIETLPAGPEDNWLQLYRKLVDIHGLLEDALPDLDEEEYMAIVQKMVQLAEAVAASAAVEVSAGSMFALMLVQVHLNKYENPKPVRRRTVRRKRSPKKQQSKPAAGE